MNLHAILYLTVFLTGAAVLVLEIAAIRVLTPYFGASLYVLSSVLTVILAALSLGYWLGGIRADRSGSLKELYLIISMSGITILALLIASRFLLPTLSQEFSVVTGPLFFSTSLFFIPALLLGMVSPYIIALQSQFIERNTIGDTVGKFFLWGTVGSIAGSLAAGFWLIPTLGVTKTIVLVSIVLVGLGVVMPLLIKQPVHRSTFPVLIISLLLSGLNTIPMQLAPNIVYADEGLYSSIRVEDTTYRGREARLLRRDTNFSSAIFPGSKELVFHYTTFAPRFPEVVPEAENFLMLGGGAYTIPRTLTHHFPELAIDVVEIEPQLYKLAQEYFDLTDTSQIENHVVDARVFLARTESNYDVIFGDLFGTNHAAPPHLTSLEFYQLVHERLNDNGVFMLNVIGDPSAPAPSLIGSVAKTLGEVFPNSNAYLLAGTETGIQNVMFVGRKGSAPITFESDPLVNRLPPTGLARLLPTLARPDDLLLTDDHAPVDSMIANERRAAGQI